MTSPEPVASFRQQAAVLGCCLVAALASSGAVTRGALAGFVVPCCLLIGLLALVLSRVAGPASSAGLASLAALGVAELTNVTSGDTSGPVARATFLTGACTALAVTAARRLSPTLVTVGVTGVLVSALWLGGADEVLPVLMVLVLLLTLVLPSLARRERRELSGRRRLVVPMLALVAAGGALAGDRLQEALQPGPPVVFDAAQVQLDITPRGLDRRDSVDGPTSAAEPPAPSSAQGDAPSGWWDRHRVRLLAVVGLLLVEALLLRLITVRLRWARLRRRLRHGDAGTSTLGAWTWAMRRLGAFGVSVPVSLALDHAATGSARLGVNANVAEHLRTLAAAATVAGFSATPGRDGLDAADAWALSDTLVARQRQDTPRVRRILASLQ